MLYNYILLYIPYIEKYKNVYIVTEMAELHNSIHKHIKPVFSGKSWLPSPPGTASLFPI